MSSGSSNYRGRGRGRFQYRKRGFPAKVVNKNNEQRSTSAVKSQQPGPYKGWTIYFPQEEYVEGSETETKIKAVQMFIKKNESAFNLTTINANFINLDLDLVLANEDFLQSWSSFDEDLSNNPRYVLDCVGLAFYETFNASQKISVRPQNHNMVLPLTNLKMNYFGKLVTIKGTVIRVGSPGETCKSMLFECSSCHASQSVLQPQGIHTAPASCTSCGSLGKFDAMPLSPLTITENSQIVKVQEMQTQVTSGSIPKIIEVEFFGDLVGLVRPGDLISVTGIVQVRNEPRDDGKKSGRLLQIYVEAVSVHNQRTLHHTNLTFTLSDYHAIQEIHNSGNVFQLLVQSLCPSIYGHEIVKAGLVLGLMGGTEIKNGSRYNPHILIVGDPGLGKSQLLQAATLVAPRGVYVCGNSCTASGLTVSLSRSEGGGFTLEAGSLVLADRGVCCVDELDKLGTLGHGALLEAMEQGTVSVARGGVVCRLEAAPTILAAANPVQGHYDRSKTVSENLHMNPALLSRFDLIFILLDRPNEKADALLSNHVLAMHSGKAYSKLNETNIRSNYSLTQVDNQLLSAKLKLKRGEEFHPLPFALLRKYIAYARKYIHPKLSEDAANVLKDFFITLRKTHKFNRSSSSITTRQLEACIRLTQARARINLREEATEEDARDVVEIMKSTSNDVLYDSFSNLSMNKSVQKSGGGGRSQVKKFIGCIMQQAAIRGTDTFTRAELCNIHKINNLSGDAKDLIDTLQMNGCLLLKPGNVYKITNV